jgi:hypothetical protein
MYEMEGPRSAAQPSTPIAQLPVTRLLSAAGPTTSPRPGPELRFPAAPRPPESPPDRHPRLVVSAFLLRRAGPAQGLSAGNLKILWPSTGHPPLSPA